MNRLVISTLLILAAFFVAACPPLTIVLLVLALGGRIKGGAQGRRAREAARARAELQRERELILAFEALP